MKQSFIQGALKTQLSIGQLLAIRLCSLGTKGAKYILDLLEAK